MAVREELQKLSEVLARYTREGVVYEKLDDNRVRCFACGHRCLIPEGRPGVCRIRFNEGGILKVPSGYVAALNCDPIEKKPFFHVLPGTDALSFGMLGCDFHCAYCQNWITSQALRDINATTHMRPVTPQELVDLAIRYDAKTITSTYNEPLITSEWAVEVFQLAKEKGLFTSYVSNGNGTPEVLEYIRPWIDFYKVDLKSFRDKEYRKLGGTLQAVLDTIKWLKAHEVWMEIVTLLVPGINDSKEELTELTEFLYSVDPFMPWHVTAFHEDYKMHGMGNTQLRSLLKAAEIGKNAGLKYVYIGNAPGRVSEWENTYCHNCDELLVERIGFRVLQNRVRDNVCPSCSERIPGIWNQ